MRTLTIEIPACQSIDQAAQTLVDIIRIGAADVVITEFNSVWLEARRGTTAQMVVAHWDAEQQKAAAERVVVARENRKRLALYPEMLALLKRIATPNTMLLNPPFDDVDDLIIRCETPATEETENETGANGF